MFEDQSENSENFANAFIDFIFLTRVSHIS